MVKEVEKKIYCGSKKLQQNKRYGTMDECLERDQVGYWGIKRIDPILLQKQKVLQKSNSKIIDNYMIQIEGLKGRIKKLKKDLEYSKSLDESNNIKNEIKEIIAKGKEMQKIVDDLINNKDKIKKGDLDEIAKKSNKIDSDKKAKKLQEKEEAKAKAKAEKAKIKEEKAKAKEEAKAKAKEEKAKAKAMAKKK